MRRAGRVLGNSGQRVEAAAADSEEEQKVDAEPHVVAEEIAEAAASEAESLAVAVSAAVSSAVMVAAEVVGQVVVEAVAEVVEASARDTVSAEVVEDAASAAVDGSAG